MPSPMIYQDLTTTALLSHAAQYHSETEIVSVGAGGEKAQQLGSGQPRSAAGIGAGVAGAAAGCPLRHPRMEQSPPPEIYFAVASGGWVTHTVNPRLSVDHLRYILNDAADEVLFFDQTFCRWWRSSCPQLPTVKHVVLMAPRSEAALSQLPSLLFLTNCCSRDGRLSLAAAQ